MNCKEKDEINQNGGQEAKDLWIERRSMIHSLRELMKEGMVGHLNWLDTWSEQVTGDNLHLFNIWFGKTCARNSFREESGWDFCPLFLLFQHVWSGFAIQETGDTCFSSYVVGSMLTVMV